MGPLLFLLFVFFYFSFESGKVLVHKVEHPIKFVNCAKRPFAIDKAVKVIRHSWPEPHLPLLEQGG